MQPSALQRRFVTFACSGRRAPHACWQMHAHAAGALLRCDLVMRIRGNEHARVRADEVQGGRVLSELAK